MPQGATFEIRHLRSGPCGPGTIWIAADEVKVIGVTGSSTERLAQATDIYLNVEEAKEFHRILGAHITAAEKIA